MARDRITRGLMMDGRRSGKARLLVTGTTFVGSDKPYLRGTVDAPAGGASRSVAQNDFTPLKATIGNNRNGS